MGFWDENHLFGVFSSRCLELSNSLRNGIKIQSWKFLNILEYNIKYCKRKQFKTENDTDFIQDWDV